MTRMEANRLEFHELLKDLLGSNEVYYQKPVNTKMRYPAIVYERDEIANDHADGIVFKQEYAYSVKVIDWDPDSVIVDRVSKIPRSRYVRHYVADGLNHDIFTIYF